MSRRRPAAVMSPFTGAALAIAVITTLALRVFAADATWGARPAWLAAFGVALALLACRIAVMAASVRRGELRGSRLLLPGIFFVEGLGVWWGDGGSAWQLVRFATAIALELALVGLAIHHVWRAPPSDELSEERLARPLERLLPPRVARMIALELTVMGLALRYLFGGWRQPARPGFTYHREAMLRMFLPVLPLMAAADVVLLEVIILPNVATWIRVVVHILALYGVVWMIGLWASFRTRPHQVHDGRALLHRGLLRHVELPLDQIVSVAPMPIFGDDWKLRAYRKGATRIDVSGPPTLELRLRAPLASIGLFGPGRARDHLLVSVDDPAAFTAALTAGATSPARVATS